jgi:hypothetical protein
VGPADIRDTGLLFGPYGYPTILDELEYRYIPFDSTVSHDQAAPGTDCFRRADLDIHGGDAGGIRNSSG